MDDRTRSTEAPLHPYYTQRTNEGPGLALAALMIVIVGAMMVAGLATAIGKWPAVLIVLVLFSVFVWMIPSDKAPSGKPSWRAGRASPGRRSPVGRALRRGLTVACMGVICGIVMSALPGCAESQANVAAHQALQTNNDILAPFTLRGIDDAEEAYPGEDGISPALAAQYRGLVDDNEQLIDTLNGRPADGAGVAVEPERDTP